MRCSQFQLSCGIEQVWERSADERTCQSCAYNHDVRCCILRKLGVGGLL